MRYICILRGINVGGHRKILMKDLIASLENEEFKDVKTYIQSGNIGFDYNETKPSFLEIKIKKIIENQYGFDVPTIVLTGKEVENVINNFPFGDVENTHVTFLQTIPNERLVEELQHLEFSPDEFIINEKAIYLKCTNKYHKSKLSNNFFEKKLKTSATTRNWKTVIKLKELAVK